LEKSDIVLRMVFAFIPSILLVTFENKLDDILHARVETIGIVESEYELGSVSRGIACKWRVCDVSGVVRFVFLSLDSSIFLFRLARLGFLNMDICALNNLVIVFQSERRGCRFSKMVCYFIHLGGVNITVSHR